MAALMKTPTREMTAAEAIYWESPPGPNWAMRLTAALKAEYRPEWIGPCASDRHDGPGARWYWWVRNED